MSAYVSTPNNGVNAILPVPLPGYAGEEYPMQYDKAECFTCNWTGLRGDLNRGGGRYACPVCGSSRVYITEIAPDDEYGDNEPIPFTLSEAYLGGLCQ